MPGNDTTANVPPRPTRLPAFLTWMPVQLVVLFVVLAALGWYVVHTGRWRRPSWRRRPAAAADGRR